MNDVSLYLDREAGSTINGADLSIIVPVKNDRERMLDCLRSLVRQIPPERICVVDNGSSDGSADAAREFGVHVLECPNLKVGALRNRGVEQLPGDVLAFVDSDHEVDDGWMRFGLEAFSQAEDVVAAGAHYLPPKNATWVQHGWAIHRLRGTQRGEVDWLGAGNLFVRRKDFERIGGFREDLVAAEDVDLCHRLRQNGGRILCDDRIRNIHHGEPKSLRDFFKKEWWRGSSGVKAWMSQGFPLRELPSLIWPGWHLFLGLAVLVLASSATFSASAWWWGIAATALVLWVMPACLLALKTGSQEGQWRAIPQLAILYFTYGIARAVSLIRPLRHDR